MAYLAFASAMYSFYNSIYENYCISFSEDCRFYPISNNTLPILLH